MIKIWTTPARWPVITSLFSAALLAGAHFFEKVLGYDPCQMCLWQREVHWAILAVSAAALVVGRLTKADIIKLLFIGLIAIALFVSFGMGLWHTGVEYGWWEGPKSCMATPPSGDIQFDPNAFLDGLGTEEFPSCGDVPWTFILSMAGWNALLSLLMAIATLGVLWKRKA